MRAWSSRTMPSSRTCDAATTNSASMREHHRFYSRRRSTNWRRQSEPDSGPRRSTSRPTINQRNSARPLAFRLPATERQIWCEAGLTVAEVDSRFAAVVSADIVGQWTDVHQGEELCALSEGHPDSIRKRAPSSTGSPGVFRLPVVPPHTTISVPVQTVTAPVR